MTTLREAARALANRILDSEPPDPSWHALQVEAQAVREAYYTSPPGLLEAARVVLEGQSYGPTAGTALVSLDALEDLQIAINTSQPPGLLEATRALLDEALTPEVMRDVESRGFWEKLDKLRAAADWKPR